MMDRLKVTIEVNDFADICVKLSPCHTHERNARIIYYFETGSMHDESNKLPSLDGYKSNFARRSTRMNKTRKTEGFRVVLDPKAIDPVTEKISSECWPQDISEFTLNNRYIIFKAQTRLWSIQVEDLAKSDQILQNFPQPFLDLTDLCSEDNSFIKKVHGGNSADGSKIAIDIRRDDEKGKSTLVSWVLGRNAE
jgi:hypothetical protein